MVPAWDRQGAVVAEPRTIGLSVSHWRVSMVLAYRAADVSGVVVEILKIKTPEDPLRFAASSRVK